MVTQPNIALFVQLDELFPLHQSHGLFWSLISHFGAKVIGPHQDNDGVSLGQKHLI